MVKKSITHQQRIDAYIGRTLSLIRKIQVEARKDEREKCKRASKNK